MDDRYVELRVVYQDLPDMIEIETVVRYSDWSGRSLAYGSPELLENDARNLIAWSRAPTGTFTLEAGADTGIGWLLLRFFTIDAAGHARCGITLATGGTSHSARPSETWRLSIELPTELGLIERFGNECSAMGRDYSRTARLIGIPT